MFTSFMSFTLFPDLLSEHPQFSSSPLPKSNAFSSSFKVAPSEELLDGLLEVLETWVFDVLFVSVLSVLGVPVLELLVLGVVLLGMLIVFGVLITLVASVGPFGLISAALCWDPL